MMVWKEKGYNAVIYQSIALIPTNRKTILFKEPFDAFWPEKKNQ